MFGKVGRGSTCRHCDTLLKASGYGEMPCSWDALAEGQRRFLLRAGMDAARWCEHRHAEERDRLEVGGCEQYAKLSKPSQSFLL